MPPANTAAAGAQMLVNNKGTNSFTVTDTSGNQIAVIAASQSWLIVLTSNATTNGTWDSIQMGATTSSAQASSLAGAGLVANGALLDLEILTNTYSANEVLVAANLATLNIYDGQVAGTFQLDTITNLGVGWFCAVANQGGANLTVTTSSSQTINGASTLALAPGASAVIVCASGGFNTYGNVQSPLSVAAGGTGGTTPISALTNLGGTTLGISIFMAPTAASVIALLGLSQTTLTESTVSTNQALTGASTQTAFVCTAPLTLTLPLTTGLTKAYLFVAYAQGGNVTVTPQSSDAINGGTAGASYTINSGSSALFMTDANGNWWPFYVTSAGTVTSVGLTAPNIFTVAGSPVTGSGSITLTLATQGANTVFAGPTSGSAAAPTFRAIVPLDIPFSESTTGSTVNPPASLATYVASAAMQIDLPLTTDLTTAFTFHVLAQGGNITLAPQSSDAIQGGSVGANFVVTQGASATIVTDANGNWWLLGLNAIPPGTMVPYAGSTAPTGWLLSYGQSLATASYPALFAAIGYTFGGSGANFNTPDMRGRVAAAADAMGGSAANRLGSGATGGITGAATLGASGGQQEITLGLANLPNSVYVTPGTNNLTLTGGSGTGVNAAGGSATNTTQPTLVTNYIIKT